MVWSLLAGGRLAPAADTAPARSASDPFADMLYTEEASDRAIIDAAGTIAETGGVTRRRSPSPGCDAIRSWLPRSWAPARPVTHLREYLAAIFAGRVELTPRRASLCRALPVLPQRR
jgi:hypothetical protein